MMMRIRKYGMCVAGMLLLLLITGCAQAPPSTPETSPEIPSAACETKECFIAAAGACEGTEMTLTEEAGTFRYATSTDCVFTKTMVAPNPAETQEMKGLLQGKSLTCSYEGGKFDQRWVTSLIFGSERCEGELKDTLAQLLIFD